jgi:hypothetical protein
MFNICWQGYSRAWIGTLENREILNRSDLILFTFSPEPIINRFFTNFNFVPNCSHADSFSKCVDHAAWFFFRAIKKEVAISFFADCGLTGHRIGEEQSALRVPTLWLWATIGIYWMECTVFENIRSDWYLLFRCIFPKFRLF